MPVELPVTCVAGLKCQRIKPLGAGLADECRELVRKRPSCLVLTGMAQRQPVHTGSRFPWQDEAPSSHRVAGSGMQDPWCFPSLSRPPLPCPQTLPLPRSSLHANSSLKVGFQVHPNQVATLLCSRRAPRAFPSPRNAGLLATLQLTDLLLPLRRCVPYGLGPRLT